MKRLSARIGDLARDRRRRLVATVGGIALLAILIAGAIALQGNAPVFGQSLVIGYVDMQRALDSHPRKAPSERALQEFFQAKQREFSQRARALTAAQRQQLDRDLQQQVIQKRQELLAGLDKDLRTAIEEVAQAEGIGIVLERSVVLFGGVDLTQQVMKRIGGK